jgi:hypothetical protein
MLLLRTKGSSASKGSRGVIQRWDTRTERFPTPHSGKNILIPTNTVGLIPTNSIGFVKKKIQLP